VRRWRPGAGSTWSASWCSPPPPGSAAASSATLGDIPPAALRDQFHLAKLLAAALIVLGGHRIVERMAGRSPCATPVASGFSASSARQRRSTTGSA
jgi:hypothetical protein